MADTGSSHPKVFISYSHDSSAHEDRVRALADRFRGDGIDCVIDQYETNPPEGWPRWMERQLRGASFVLLICTEIYNRRVLGEEDPGKGLGVLWESNIIYNSLYNTGTVDRRFLPVVFGKDNVVNIPTPLQGVTRYDVQLDDEYDRLYRYLTDQPSVLKPTLGKLREMPARERKSALDDSDLVSAELTPSVAAATLKRYLDEGQRTRAHDLLLEETRRLHDGISDERFPVNGVRIT